MPMFAVELIREALRNLARHKLRSLLTTLGIIFGVASVLSMVAIGEGARVAILDQISELGIRNVIINTKKPPEETDVSEEEDQQSQTQFGLTFRDARQIEGTLPFVERVLPVHDIEKWIWFKSDRVAAKVRGVTPDYFDVLNLDPIIGRTLSIADGERRKRVAVVRSRLLKEAGYVGNPLQLDLRIGTDFYRVVGVLPDFEFQSPNKSVLGIDDLAMEVYVPFETAIDRFGLRGSNRGDAANNNGYSELHQIVAVIKREDIVLDGARAVQAILTTFHDRK
ncbi:MAG: ABC transporter permease, partial [Planctomycetota bacterium]